MDASLLIIGAGPAGLLAAWTAARRRLPGGVLVLDRMPQAGVKLAVTGGGRGNLSHLATEEEFAAAFGRQGRFAIPAFRSLAPEDLRTRLAEAGVPTVVDPDGRLYPRSQSAAQVRDALFAACTREGVRFVFSRDVKSLRAPAPNPISGRSIPSPPVRFCWPPAGDRLRGSVRTAAASNRRARSATISWRPRPP